MEYPDTCIRGLIADPSWVKKLDGIDRATGAAFQFQKRKDGQEDAWMEASINWKDDANAIPFTLNMKKEDNITIRFPTGVALVPQDTLDWILKRYGSRVFKYERRAAPGNDYHGNLLVSNLADEGGMPFKRMISDTLAVFAEVHLRANITPPPP